MSDEHSSFSETHSSEPDRPSDANLLSSVKLKRKEALGILYDRYAGLVAAVCLRIVRDPAAAEKIVEEVFYDLWQHPDRGSGPLVNRLVSHARTIAIQRRRFPSPPLNLAADAPYSAPNDKSADDPNLRWKRERTLAALACVPNDARQIVEMAYLNAWHIDEIAGILNLGPKAVRARLGDGIRAFQEALQSTPAAAKQLSPFDFPPVSLDRVRVLVVDDEPDARRVLTYALQAVGALVTVAASVAEALALLPNAKPELLLSDLAMPDEDGFDLIRKVRRAGRTARELPAVALTAYVTKQVRRDVMLAGFQMHVAKPVDPHELAEVVASLTGRTGLSA